MRDENPANGLGGGDAAMVDEAALLAVRSEFGAELFAEIGAALIADVEAGLPALAEAAARSDATAAASACHAMIGAASTLGLTGFCAAARGIEEAALAGTCPDGQALDRLSALWSRSVAALRRSFLADPEEPYDALSGSETSSHDTSSF